MARRTGPVRLLIAWAPMLWALQVVGTQPNFTEIAALVPALREYPEIAARLP